VSVSIPAPEAGEARPARYARVARELAERFARTGVVGVVVVGAPEMGRVERFYGREATHRVGDAMVRAIDEVCADRRGADDMLIRADHGRDEIALFFFRDREDHDFYREGVSTIAADLREHLSKQGARIFYPYVRSAPPIDVGWTVAIRSPLVAEGRQIHAALEDARLEAELVGRLRSRMRRLEFQHLLMREDVTILFEPIVNMATRDILGFEALVRGPAGSDVRTPGAFFQRAEEAGLLFEADSLCRRRALVAARGLAPGRKLFLNCLPSAIRDPQFRGAALQQALERQHLRPTDVVLEISERESIGNFAVFREARDHFASLGLGIALDDTGVGYSSLEAVMELSPDFIKVDQVLVRGIDTDPPRRLRRSSA
jgi:EAL domain-containing protein (putative c-di-GMP-specific phosphodiesterase class I)